MALSRRACGACGESGHNARTCPKRSGAVTGRAPKLAPAPAVAPAYKLVLEELEARWAQLAKEIATIDRLIPDLRELGGGR